MHVRQLPLSPPRSANHFGRARIAAIRAVLLAVTVTACTSVSPSTNDVLGSLPKSAAGLDFSVVQVIDDSFLSGHSVDAALRFLGKERKDASAVFRHDAEFRAGVGGVAVNGVEGPRLLEAILQTWDQPAVEPRSQRQVGQRQVWELARRSGDLNVFYLRGAIVYVVSGSDRSLIDRIVAVMP
jgi:hypothetical protein